MATIDFNFNSTVTTIQCTQNEKIKEICNRYSMKIGKNINDIYFIYDGNKLDNNSFEKEFYNIANNNDKERNKMNILVYELNEENKKNNMKQSKEIICPKCKESIRLEIKDYKIRLFGCKNKHIFDNITFDKFEDSQLIDESKIICGKCEQNNKSNTFENVFYKCNKCKINLCPICKSNHDQSHNIINYDLKYFICEKHNENYISFCNNCLKNMCALCMEEDNDNNHKIDIYKRPNINNKINELKELKIKIQEMHKEMDEIITFINYTIYNAKKNIDKYFNICENLINNCDCDLKNRNYEKIENINCIINKDILSDIKVITLNNNNISSKFKKILEINKKIIKPNEIKKIMDNRRFAELEYHIKEVIENTPYYIEQIKENVKMVEDEYNSLIKREIIERKIYEIYERVSEYKSRFENLKIIGDKDIIYEKQIHPKRITEFEHIEKSIKKYSEFLHKNENEKLIYWKIPFVNKGINIEYDNLQIYTGKKKIL